MNRALPIICIRHTRFSACLVLFASKVTFSAYISKFRLIQRGFPYPTPFIVVGERGAHVPTISPLLLLDFKIYAYFIISKALVFNDVKLVVNHSVMSYLSLITCATA